MPRNFSKETEEERKKGICTCFFQPCRLIFPLFGTESQPSSLDSGFKKCIFNNFVYLK